MALDRLRDRALWRHIAIEIVIVTAGILIAFSLDSWWEGRQEARREQAHLRALAADFQQNAGSLREVAERDESVATSAGTLLSMMRERPNATRDEVWPVLSKVFSNLTYEPVLGAYDTLVSAGDLALIRDAELRRLLVSFAAQVKESGREASWAGSYRDLHRELAGRIQMGAWGPASDDPVVAARQSRWDTQLLFGDARFEDHLTIRWAGAREMAAYHRRLATAADRIVATIAELTD